MKTKAKTFIVTTTVKSETGAPPKLGGYADTIFVWCDKGMEAKSTLKSKRVATREIRTLLKGFEKTLLNIDCSFWSCPGPDVPFESMKTCFVCQQIQATRAALKRLDKS